MFTKICHKQTLFFVVLLIVWSVNLAAEINAENWTNAINATLANFVYNKVDANFFVQNKEIYDGTIEIVEFKTQGTRSKHSYTSNAGTPEQITNTRYLSLEHDGVYAFDRIAPLSETNTSKSTPNSEASGGEEGGDKQNRAFLKDQEFLKSKTNLPFIPEQTQSTFLLGPDNIFHGFVERIANYEPMFMDFMIAIKDNFDWVVFQDGKFLVKEDRFDEMWAPYIERGRKLSDIEMHEIYFVIQDGKVSECGFSASDNEIEVKHIYTFQFDNVTFDFPEEI